MADVGLVGYGAWGQNLARVLHHEGVLKAIIDIDEARLSHAVSTHHFVMTYLDFEDALHHSKMDAVVVAVPPRAAKRIIEIALKAGLHVLTEKPLALSYDGALDLCELAEKTERVLMVDHIFRYSPAVRLVWSLIRSGVIGTLRHVSLKRLGGAQSGGSRVLWDLAVHDLSILAGLGIGTPINVRALRQNILRILYDHATLNLMYESDLIMSVQIEVGWVAPRKRREGLFVGSEGMIEYDELSPDAKVKIFRADGDVLIPHLEWREPLALMIDDFLALVAIHSRPVVSREAGWGQIQLAKNELLIYQILDMAEKSAKEGGKCVSL